MEPLPYQSVEALGATRAMRRYWRMIVGLVLICGIGGYFYAAQVRGPTAPRPRSWCAPWSAMRIRRRPAPPKQRRWLCRRRRSWSPRRRSLIWCAETCRAPRAMQDLVTAKVLTNTQLIKISAKAASADTARRCAQEYATDYLARRQQVAAAAQTGQLAALTAQLAATEKALATATAVAEQPAPAAGRGGTGGGGERVAGRGPEPGWPAPGALDATREPRRGGERSADGK